MNLEKLINECGDDFGSFALMLRGRTGEDRWCASAFKKNIQCFGATPTIAVEKLLIALNNKI